MTLSVSGDWICTSVKVVNKIKPIATFIARVPNKKE